MKDQSGNPAIGQHPERNVAATFRSPDGRTSEKTWRRRNNRLPPENYVGPNAYLITAATENRLPRFKEAKLVKECVAKLVDSSKVEHFEVLAFVFMPDHLHLLLLGDEQSDLAKFMKRYKQETGFAFKRLSGEVLWQKSYHDHILRREEGLNDAARYIAANPVRAGIVEHWQAYPFTGGWLLDGARDGDLKVAATDSWAPI